MTIDEQRQAIREGLKHLVLVGDCSPCFHPGGPSCYDCTPADNKVRNILAFLTENGAVLKTDEGHVGILIHRLSDGTEVPMTAFAPLIEPEKPSG